MIYSNKITTCLFLALSFLFGACSSPSGKSGFLLNGKEYILYKNGNSVKKHRELASAKPSDKVLYFQEDQYARCYYLTGAKESSRPLECIKKK